MNNNLTPIEMLFQKAEEYGKAALELFQMKAIDKSADVVSSLAVRLILFITFALFAFIINIGIALWIGDLLGKSYYGFFAVAGFYFLITIFIYIFRHQWIKYPIKNSIIAQMWQQKDCTLNKKQSVALNEEIILLETRQAYELNLLRQQFYIACESLKPINVIKRMLNKMASSSEIKNNLLTNAIGLMTGYLSKKIIASASRSPIKRIFGTLIQFVVANIASKHSR